VRLPYRHDAYRVSGFRVAETKEGRVQGGEHRSGRGENPSSWETEGENIEESGWRTRASNVKSRHPRSVIKSSATCRSSSKYSKWRVSKRREKSPFPTKTQPVRLTMSNVFQIVAIFAIGLAVDPMNSFQRVFNKPRFKLDDAATIYITVAGYILINTLFILSHMLGDRVPKRTVVSASESSVKLQTIIKPKCRRETRLRELARCWQS